MEDTVNKTTDTDICVRQAGGQDYEIIAGIGKIAVADAHGRSCSVEDMNDYLAKNYNDDAIKSELNDPENIYYLIYYKDQPAGFSKIVLNVASANIQPENVTKLDRIYLLKEFYDLKLGFELLQYNIEYSKNNNQAGMWLFTWTGNERAVNFYKRTGFAIVGDHQFKVSENHYNPNYQMFLRY